MNNQNISLFIPTEKIFSYWESNKESLKTEMSIVATTQDSDDKLILYVTNGWDGTSDTDRCILSLEDGSQIIDAVECKDAMDTIVKAIGLMKRMVPSKRTRLFISQPFTGKTEDEVFEIRKEVENYVKGFMGDNLEVIDQYHQDAPDDNPGRLFYLGNSIKMMGEADFVCFTSDWRDAPGCRVEMSVCLEYGIPHIIMDSKRIR